MPAPDDLAARIDTLEERFAFQDRMLEDLNRVLIDQWKKIDLLTRQITGLEDRIRAGEQRADLAGLPEPPPPHY